MTIYFATHKQWAHTALWALITITWIYIARLWNRIDHLNNETIRRERNTHP